MSVFSKKPDNKGALKRVVEESKGPSLRESFSSQLSVKVVTLSLAEKQEDNINLSKCVQQKDDKLEGLAKKLEIGCVSQEGLYHENEDRMAYGLSLNSEIDGFVGVFDGHGGEDCADYVSSGLATNILRHFKKVDDWKHGEKIMKEMFHSIETDFLKLAVEEDDTSGSCATVVLVRNLDVLIANIGDCKAVAVPKVQDSEGGFIVLTGDHRADAPEEETRITKAGGNVVEGRVCNLQPSRSFGDLDVKEIVGEGIVIPTPEVSRVKMQPGGFMIVATDGLWDSVDTESAVKVCKDRLISSRYDAESAADELVELATKNQSSDDITVSVIVWKQEPKTGV